MTKDEQQKVREFRNAVDRFLTSASNPGRASAVIHDNTPGSPYHELVMAKIEVDALLSDRPSSDAARYRWLKTHHLQLGPDCWIRTGDDLDEAIDAEIRTAPQEKV